MSPLSDVSPIPYTHALFANLMLTHFQCVPAHSAAFPPAAAVGRIFSVLHCLHNLCEQTNKD